MGTEGRLNSREKGSRGWSQWWKGIEKGKARRSPRASIRLLGVNSIVCPSGTETPDELTPVN